MALFRCGKVITDAGMEIGRCVNYRDELHQNVGGECQAFKEHQMYQLFLLAWQEICLKKCNLDLWHWLPVST